MKDLCDVRDNTLQTVQRYTLYIIYNGGKGEGVLGMLMQCPNEVMLLHYFLEWVISLILQ